MNVVAAENVDREIVDRLRDGGISVLYIAETDASINDETVLEQSRRDGALLVTADKDFGDLVFRQRLAHTGILLVRLEGVEARINASLVPPRSDNKTASGR